MHRTPAGFPPGIPGMGEEMEGAIQQAPQSFLQFIDLFRSYGLSLIRDHEGINISGNLPPRPQGQWISGSSECTVQAFIFGIAGYLAVEKVTRPACF
jgi:hypothetical protein